MNKSKIKIFIMLGLAVVLIIILTYKFLQENKTGITPLPQAVSKRVPEHHPDTILKDIDTLLTQDKDEIKNKDVLKPTKSSLKRDLFSPTISLHKKGNPLPKEEKKKETDKIEDMIKELKLKATLINNQRPVSIINNRIVGIGDYIMGFKVVEIKDGLVLLSNGEKKVSLNMKGKNNETLQ